MGRQKMCVVVHPFNMADPPSDTRHLPFLFPGAPDEHAADGAVVDTGLAV